MDKLKNNSLPTLEEVQTLEELKRRKSEIWKQMEGKGSEEWKSLSDKHTTLTDKIGAIKVTNFWKFNQKHASITNNINELSEFNLRYALSFTERGDVIKSDNTMTKGINTDTLFSFPIDSFKVSNPLRDDFKLLDDKVDTLVVDTESLSVDYYTVIDDEYYFVQTIQSKNAEKIILLHTNPNYIIFVDDKKTHVYELGTIVKPLKLNLIDVSNPIHPDFEEPEPVVNRPLVQLGLEEVQKKSGGGGSDWKKKPTFGKSHNTYSQLIDNRFHFNGYVLTITDNWHTDFVKTTSIIGDENHVRIITYAADTLKQVTLSLGIPEIGQKSNAETSIILNLEHDYKTQVLYSVSEIVHEQKEDLINEDKTRAYVSNVKCNEDSNSKSCYAFDIFFTVMAPLSHDVLAISAVDNHRRSHTTFINEGVEFIGESLLDPETTKIFQKKSNQDKGNWLELIREDRRYNQLILKPYNTSKMMQC